MSLQSRLATAERHVGIGTDECPRCYRTPGDVRAIIFRWPGDGLTDDEIERRIQAAPKCPVCGEPCPLPLIRSDLPVERPDEEPSSDFDP